MYVLFIKLLNVYLIILWYMRLQKSFFKQRKHVQPKNAKSFGNSILSIFLVKFIVALSSSDKIVCSSVVTLSVPYLLW